MPNLQSRSIKTFSLGLKGTEQPKATMPNSKTGMFPNVGEGVTSVTNENAWANVEIPGTGNHASNALKRAGWDGRTPMASVIMTVDAGVLKGTQWILRGGLGEVTLPLQRIQDDKSMKVTLDLSDLSKVKFPTIVDPTKGGANHSLWIDGVSLATRLTFGATTLTEESAIKANSFMKSEGFSLR